jgi:hypothetical protein
MTQGNFMYMGNIVSKEPSDYVFTVASYTLNNVTACSSETLISIYQTTRRHTLGDTSRRILCTLYEVQIMNAQWWKFMPYIYIFHLRKVQNDCN